MIIERIKKPIEIDLSVTPGTTPIVYFGNYDSAKACTIGLNPSKREFQDKNGNILDKTEKRLCSRKELGKKDLEALTDADAKRVMEACKDYFKNRPYEWFEKLEYTMKKFGYSYYDDTCVHLNLVQWATKKSWSKLDDNIQRQHLQKDLPVLEHLLNKKSFEKIFLNSYEAVSIVRKYLPIKLTKRETTFVNTDGKTIPIKIYYGKYNESGIIGTRYLQRPPIKSDADIDLLYETVTANSK